MMTIRYNKYVANELAEVEHGCSLQHSIRVSEVQPSTALRGHPCTFGK